MKPLQASISGETDHPLPQQLHEEVERIIHSRLFRNAPALQRLLRYLALKTINGEGDQLKEYTIGVEAFDRGEGYDPKIDTVVRVEMHRLRQRLKEYYGSDGGEDPIFVEIPRGHYVPTFKNGLSPDGESNGSSGSSKPLLFAEDEPQPASEESVPKGGNEVARRNLFSLRRAAIFGAPLLLFISGIVLGTRWTRFENANLRKGSFVTSSAAAKSNDLVHEFWTAFLGKDNRPIVGYADAVFLVDESDDLFRFRHGASDNRGAPVDPHLARQFASNSSIIAEAGPLFYNNGYSGIGDVQSVYRFTKLFTQMGYRGVVAERCRLVTIDNLQEHNVILLGSSFENDAVAQLPREGDFAYKESPDRVHALWNGSIIDRHPRPGEATSYKVERDPVTRVVKADYGLVTVEPGITPGHYIAIVGALDTSGVMGATQFITSESGLSELVNHLQTLGENTDLKKPPYFQALLKVDVENGLDVFRVHLITVHPINAAKTAATASPDHPTSKAK
jgi:hypothetical protein